jgi:hypothetical protein
MSLKDPFDAFLANKDQLIGTAESPGFIERTVGKPMVVRARIAPATACSALGLWLFINARNLSHVCRAPNHAESLTPPSDVLAVPRIPDLTRLGRSTLSR